MLVTPTGHAETRLAFKSAQTTSPYYQMALQIAAATAAASGGELIIDVEDSQGPVQNLEEAAMRAESYVFTTPPAVTVAGSHTDLPFGDLLQPGHARELDAEG
jgi:hypothetical protein